MQLTRATRLIVGNMAWLDIRGTDIHYRISAPRSRRCSCTQALADGHGAPRVPRQLEGLLYGT